MRRKILASIATFIVIVGGVVSPTLSFVFSGSETPHAYAANDATTSGTAVQPQQLQDAKQTELDCGANFMCSITISVMEAFMYAPVFLSTVAGLVFDFSIWYSLQSGTYTKFDGQVGDEGLVVTGWKLVRDFTNLVFIFALFVIAFTLILNLDERADGSPFGLDPKRTIARVIIMALLVNFSFFIGRTVIDITNVFGLAFYNRISAAPVVNDAGSNLSGNLGGQSTGDPATFYKNFLGIRSLSTNIIGQVNPQQLMLDTGHIKSSGWIIKSYDLGVYVLLYFLTILSFFFNLFLVYIFGSIALLFFARTIGLYLGVIVSPIAFVSWTVPALQKMNFIGFDDWAKQFFGLAFMAPVFLFFLYIIIQFFNVSAVGGGSGYLAIGAEIVVKIGIIGALLIYARKIAKDLSGKIGDAAGSVIAGVVGAAAVGVGGFAAGAAAGQGFFGKIAGGATSVARMGGNYVKQKAISATNTAANAALGEERADEFRKRWGTLKNFDKRPGAAFQAFTRAMATGQEKTMLGQISDSFRAGRTANRRYDMMVAQGKNETLLSTKKLPTDGARRKMEEKAAKAWKEFNDKQKVKDIDKELDELKKKFEEGLLTDNEYKAERKKLAQKKRDALLPEDQQTVLAADRQIKDLQKKINDNPANVTSRLNQATANLATAENALANSTGQVTAANQHLVDVTNQHAQALGEANQKKKDMADLKSEYDKQIEGLKDERDEALSRQQTADRLLAGIDQQIQNAPKTGPDYQNHLARLKEQRDKIAADKKRADDNLADVDLRINDVDTDYQAKHQSKLSEYNAADLQRQQLEQDRDQAQTNLDSLKATQTTHQQAVDRAREEKESWDLDALKAKKEAAEKKVKENKEKKKIEDEIKSRNRSPLTDVQNEERNLERLKELRNKLNNISNGGTTPPPTP